MPFPDLTAPELAYPGYVQQDINPKQVTKVSGVYLKNMDMPELVEKVPHSSRLNPAHKRNILQYAQPLMYCRATAQMMFTLIQ